MLYSPFTRYLGTAIASVIAAWLLWPDDDLMMKLAVITPAVLLMLAIFAWSGARDGAPFDDEAFRRTLPPGDDIAWRKVTRGPLSILAVIGIALAGHCVYRNFSWQTGLYGLLVIGGSAWALMAAASLAGSYSTSRDTWKTLGPLLILAAPIPGILSVDRAWPLARWAGFGAFDMSATAIATAALIYPAIGWLVAARRYRALGAGLAVWMGMLIPWLNVHADFVESQRRGIYHAWSNPRPLPPVAEIEPLPESSSWKIQRKELPKDDPEWFFMEEVLGIDGLAQGETLMISGPRLFREVDAAGISPVANLEWTYVTRDQGGRIRWGEEAVRSLLRSRLPAHESFGFLDGSRMRETRTAIRNPHFSEILQEDYDPRLGVRSGGMKLDGLREEPWHLAVKAGGSWLYGGNFELGKGGRYRLPEGGVVELLPFRYPESEKVITVRRSHEYPPSIMTFGLGKNPPAYNRGLRPRMLLLDEADKHVIALKQPIESSGRSLLGTRDQWDLTLDSPESRDREADIERYRKMRLYIFFPLEAGKAYEVELPPP